MAKDDARFLHPAQVDHHDKQHQADGDPHPVGVQIGKGRSDLRHTGRNRNRHREDIIGQQRRAGGLGGQLAQVIARDNIGAAAARVGVDGLLVGNRDDHHQGTMAIEMGKTNPSAPLPATASTIMISWVA